MERKLIAIMVGDVVGYSRLAGAYERETIEGLQACFDFIRECVSDHRGKIFNTAGDSVLAEFGSVVDAVRCALDIQAFFDEINEGMAQERRFLMRFGIHMGEVVVDGDNYLGDGVNIAARLEPLAEPGGVCVSASVYHNVQGRIDAEFSDMGDRDLKNIGRAVRAYHTPPRAEPKEEEALPETAATDAPDSFSSAPAVAVLPFDNLGGDPGDDFFADGLTEDIITALAAWRSFPVIARNSTFAYKGKSPDVRTVAEELKARYVLEGSVRRAGNRVRVNAQLIDAVTGHHIWAEKFDREVEDLFALQDEITHYLAAIVEPEIGRNEQNRIAPARPSSLGAWELYQQGMAFLNQWTREGNAQARDMFTRALKLDPRYSQAWTGLAYTHHRDIWFGYAEDRQASIDAQLEAALKAVEFDDTDSRAHCLLGFAYTWARKFDLAIAEGERAVALNPSNFVALSQLGIALSYAGRPAEGVPMLERAIGINPRNPRIYFALSALARARLNAREPEKAADMAKRALTHKADYPLAFLILASALGHMDRAEEGAAALAECRRLQPGFAKEWVSTAMYKDPADDLFLLEGLQKTGYEGADTVADAPVLAD